MTYLFDVDYEVTDAHIEVEANNLEDARAELRRYLSRDGGNVVDAYVYHHQISNPHSMESDDDE